MERRVLLRTSTSRDAIVAVAVLARSGIVALACDSAEMLIAEMDKGVGAVLLSEEVIGGAGSSSLAEWLSRQPTWSDLPILISVRPGVDSRAWGRVSELLSNVTMLERPTRIAALVSAVRSALRARERQLQLREHIAVLQDADRRRTEFLATLAHELRNPMAPLSATLSVLKVKAPLPEGMKRYYDIMGRQVDHMAKLVDDLMDVSRITRGKIVLKPQRLVFERVISDAVEISRPFIEARGHALQVAAVDKALCVQGDPVRLTQVFANLLNNAARYTPQGGSVWVDVQLEGEMVRTSIRDSGLGISPDDLAVIFDMFVQVPGTDRAAQGGLGIGLTLVKSLVEIHGGRVEAQSAGLGMGSEFSVTLPALPLGITAEGQAMTGEKQELETTGSLAGLRILVVDDTPDIADTHAELLSIDGAAVDVAYNGIEAIETFRKHSHHAAVLDIGMPGMDGYELARRLRSLEGGKELALVALTGWGQSEDRDRVAAAGFGLHLVKPVDSSQLVQWIAAAVAR